MSCLFSCLNRARFRARPVGLGCGAQLVLVDLFNQGGAL